LLFAFFYWNGLSLFFLKFIDPTILVFNIDSFVILNLPGKRSNYFFFGFTISMAATGQSLAASPAQGSSVSAEAVPRSFLLPFFKNGSDDFESHPKNSGQTLAQSPQRAHFL
jgi:hypothetical protein